MTSSLDEVLPPAELVGMVLDRERVRDRGADVGPPPSSRSGRRRCASRPGRSTGSPRPRSCGFRASRRPSAGRARRCRPPDSLDEAAKLRDAVAVLADRDRRDRVLRHFLLHFEVLRRHGVFEPPHVVLLDGVREALRGAARERPVAVEGHVGLVLHALGDPSTISALWRISPGRRWRFARSFSKPLGTSRSNFRAS